MTRISLAHLDDVRSVDLPHHVRADGDLVVMEEGKQLPFPAVRVFMVRGICGAVRGRHAHIRCNQFLVSVQGTIGVECDDGVAKFHTTLEAGSVGLLVPASIWATEIYKTDNAVLAVMCDRPYEEEDYIRNYDEFIAWRRSNS